MASSYVRSGDVLPYFFSAPFVSAQDLSNFLKRSYSFSPFGPRNGWYFFKRAMAIMKFEKFFPRAASVMSVTSFVSCTASRKRGTGAHSLVSLLIISAVPTPQFGWQPQESEPHCDSCPFTMSENPAKVLTNEIGNQSRVGSTLPTCLLTPWARWERV